MKDELTHYVRGLLNVDIILLEYTQRSIIDTKQGRCIFGSVKEPKESLCLSVCLSVRLSVLDKVL